MDKKEIVAFFDALAASWDENQVRNEAVIEKILDLGGVKKGCRVLDVACGTGVLFPDYIKREALSVTGIDISENMLSIAREKFPGVRLICADAGEYAFTDEYDVVMVYNAFPHFAHAEKLFENLSSALKRGGRLTIAHGISESELEKCHSGTAKRVSLPLPSKERLGEMLGAYVRVDVMISDENMYVVSGIKE